MIACVRLPYFATELEQRDHPALRMQPLALLDASERICFVSHQAVAAGVEVGMSAAKAAQVCPELHLRPAINSRYQQAFMALLEAFTTFTDDVEAEEIFELRADARRWRNPPFVQPEQGVDRAATCFLDLGELSPDDAVAIGQQLLQLVKTQLDVPAKLGLSAGKFPARVAATVVETGELLLVPHDNAAAFLAEFTVGLLPVDGETLRQLHLLGLDTLGQIARVPVAALVDRFGKYGRTMRRLARGRDTSPVARFTAPVILRFTHDFEPPAADWQLINNTFRAMAETMAAALRADGHVARQVTLVLTLENGMVLNQHLVLRQPHNHAQPLADTLDGMAHALPVSQRIAGLEVLLSDIAPSAPRQLSLFDRPAVSADHLNSVLEGLIRRYGEQYFYRLRAADDQARLPERRFRWEQAGDR